MANFGDNAIGQQYLNDIEPKFDLRVPQEPQVIESAQGQLPLLIKINSRCWPSPIFRRARFHFNKHKAVGIAKHQIDFAAFGFEIGSKKF